MSKAGPPVGVETLNIENGGMLHFHDGVESHFQPSALKNEKGEAFRHFRIFKFIFAKLGDW